MCAADVRVWTPGRASCALLESETGGTGGTGGAFCSWTGNCDGGSQAQGQSVWCDESEANCANDLCNAVANSTWCPGSGMQPPPPPPPTDEPPTDEPGGTGMQPTPPPPPPENGGGDQSGHQSGNHSDYDDDDYEPEPEPGMQPPPPPPPTWDPPPPPPPTDEPWWTRCKEAYEQCKADTDCKGGMDKAEQEGTCVLPLSVLRPC